MDTDTDTETGTALATQDPKSTAVAVYDYAPEDVGAGFENVETSDFKPSFLRIAQPLTPAVINELPGAKPGRVMDSITSEFFDSVEFVPAAREHVMVAWKPRNEGGGDGQGFGGVYQLNDPMVVQQLKGFDKWARGEDGKMLLPRTPDGEYQLIETVYYHGVQVLPNGGIFPATIPFTSTGIPVAGVWLNITGRQIIPDGEFAGRQRPLYAHAFKIASVKKTKEGKTWFIPTVTWAADTVEKSRLDTAGPIFAAAKKVAKAFRDGTAKVDYAASGNTTGDEAGKVNKDAEIPF